MGLAIPIETSARHIHLCQEDFEKLFGEGKSLTYQADLSQPGQYVAKERLCVKGPKGSFDTVAILGPFRPETQLEISMTDARKLFVIMDSFERSLIFADVIVRVNPNFALAMHVDTDEANAFAGNSHPTGVILKLFGGRTYNLQKWADELQSGINRL